MRILSLPGYANPQTPAAVAQRLAAAVAHASHEFWPDSFSLLETGQLRWDRVLTSRQITDAFLLALAVSRRGRLVTLDRAISEDAVAGCRILCAARRDEQRMTHLTELDASAGVGLEHVGFGGASCFYRTFTSL